MTEEYRGFTVATLADEADINEALRPIVDDVLALRAAGAKVRIVGTTAWGTLPRDWTAVAESMTIPAKPFGDEVSSYLILTWGTVTATMKPNGLFKARVRVDGGTIDEKIAQVASSDTAISLVPFGARVVTDSSVHTVALEAVSATADVSLSKTSNYFVTVIVPVATF